ncbi:hypothetical protein BGL_1c08430 [Burkholderia plantarii]|uniref:Uncharacterized protein n=1 Tax=Burkholderia plantarii TaxID=41899 RepID=A0A0B6RZI9_BURPL|nr:hypothetical protein BGL_1c08430 [Burkholderia plantarii]
MSFLGSLPVPIDAREPLRRCLFLAHRVIFSTREQRNLLAQRAGAATIEVDSWR